MPNPKYPQEDGYSRAHSMRIPAEQGTFGSWSLSRAVTADTAQSSEKSSAELAEKSADSTRYSTWRPHIADIQRRIMSGSSVRLDVVQHPAHMSDTANRQDYSGPCYTISGTSIPTVIGRAVTRSVGKSRIPLPAKRMLEGLECDATTNRRAKGSRLDERHNLACGSTAGGETAEVARWRQDAGDDELYQSSHDEWNPWIDELEGLLTEVSKEGGWVALDLLGNPSLKSDDPTFPFRARQLRATLMSDRSGSRTEASAQRGGEVDVRIGCDV